MLASRLAPCTPVLATSPQANRPATLVAPSMSVRLLNADPRRTVVVSPLMVRLAEGTVVLAAMCTDGLVDGTLLG